MSWKAILLLCITPLILGTTFIIKEGGVEVGRWVEDDGRDEEKIIENERKAYQVSSLGASHATSAAIDHKKKQMPSTEKRKAQDWGIRKGMTKGEVKKIQKYPRYLKYTDHDEGVYGNYPVWVWEYHFHTENFNHVKKVYFSNKGKLGDPELVVLEQNSSTPR